MALHTHRPIRPAPPTHEGDPKSPGGPADSPKEQKHLVKRSQITAVACQPCQQRKSKCDGVRPVCSSCLAKKRAGCAYDIAGDQRRTSALKQRIRELEHETGQLRHVIGVVCTATDREAAAKEGLQYLADKTGPSQGLDTSPTSPTTVDMLGGAGWPTLIRTGWSTVLYELTETEGADDCYGTV
ncbi:hypothetical protein BJ546DRAFT_92299 [Cryomyces antarcticus]